jgi:hypothetical protein
MSELIVCVSINNQHNWLLKSILGGHDRHVRVILERNKCTRGQVDVYCVSHCQLLHVVVSINDFLEICHVDPLAFGEVAVEGGLSVGGS